MIIWHRNREGATALLHDVEAETLQRTRFRKFGCKNPTNLQVCGPRQQPTMQKTLQIPRFHAECCKTQVLGPYHVGGGGGGGSEPRTGIIYTLYIYIYIDILEPNLPPFLKVNPSRQGVLNQKKSHLGSRCITRMLLIVWRCMEVWWNADWIISVYYIAWFNMVEKYDTSK